MPPLKQVRFQVCSIAEENVLGEPLGSTVTSNDAVILSFPSEVVTPLAL